MIQRLAISLAVMLAFALPVVGAEKPKAPKTQLKAKTGQKKLGPQIQTATSELTNADTLRSQKKKTKGVKSK